MYVILKRFINKKKSALFIGIIILVAVTLSVYIYAYGYNTYNYKKYFNAGVDNLKNEDFQSAKNDFTNALKFKRNSKDEIDKKIVEVETMAKAKQTYEDGMKNFNDGKFIVAITVFKQVSKGNEKYYNMAQDKIVQSKKAYSDENISNAKAKAAGKNYTEAIKILDMVIGFDKDNQEALGLKNQYTASIQKIKVEDDKRAAEKAKQEVAANNQSSNSINNSSSSNSKNIQPSNSEYPKIIYLSNGVHIIENKQQDDGHLGGAVISCTLDFGVQPFGIYFKLFTGGNAYYEQVPYKATFHFIGVDKVYNGVASADIKFIQIPSNVSITTGTTVKVDFQVTYKGKTYKFSDTVTCNIRS